VSRLPDTVRGTGVNISRSGICLLLPVMLEQKERINLRADLPYPHRSGEVRWTRQNDNGLYLTGLLCA
jgi:hypothetical protein